MPLPTPGLQLVSLTNVSDAVKLLAAVPGNSAAVKQHFNLTSDRAITHSGKLTRPCTSLAGAMAPDYVLNTCCAGQCSAARFLWFSKFGFGLRLNYAHCSYANGLACSLAWHLSICSRPLRVAFQGDIPEFDLQVTCIWADCG